MSADADRIAGLEREVKAAWQVLAARVPLWRELESIMRIDGNVGLIDDVLAKLAALAACPRCGAVDAGRPSGYCVTCSKLVKGGG